MKLNLPNLLPNWISNRVADPEGTAPKGLVFKIGVALLSLLMATVIFLAPADETSNDQTAAPALPPPAGPSAVAKGDQDIQTASDRRAAEQSRAARIKQQAVDRARQAEERFLREQSELEAEAAQLVDDAVKFADESPHPDLNELLTDVYLDAPPNSLQRGAHLMLP